MSIRPECVECGISSPDTNTNYTLISRTGWRLTRSEQPDGMFTMEWRCPACWAKRKSTTDKATPTAEPAPRKRAR